MKWNERGEGGGRDRPLTGHNFCSVYPISVFYEFSESTEKTLQDGIFNKQILELLIFDKITHLL